MELQTRLRLLAAVKFLTLMSYWPESRCAAGSPSKRLLTMAHWITL